MAVQNRKDNDNTPFILLPNPGAADTKATIAQDGARATDLLKHTLLAKIAATGLYVPFTSVAGVDGTAFPAGIYLGDDIAFADLVAGNVVDLPILIGGLAFIDENKLVIENSLTLDTVIGATTIHAQTVRDALNKISILPEDTIYISHFEN